MPNIKRNKTKYQKGGASGKPSGRRSNKSTKNNNNSLTNELLETRFNILNMPDVPGNPIKIPKSYKLPDLSTYIQTIRELKKPLEDETSTIIYFKLVELPSEKYAYDLIHRMRMICNDITNKTDSLFILKQKYKAKDDKQKYKAKDDTKTSDTEIIEKWITFFYKLKILFMDEIEKLYALIKDIKPQGK